MSYESDFNKENNLVFMLIRMLSLVRLQTQSYRHKKAEAISAFLCLKATY